MNWTGKGEKEKKNEISAIFFLSVTKKGERGEKREESRLYVGTLEKKKEDGSAAFSAKGGE